MPTERVRANDIINIQVVPMSIRQAKFPACCLLVLLLQAAAQMAHALPGPPAQPEKPGLVQHPCWFAVDDEAVGASCYWMFVREEHGNETSRIIGFPVIRLSANPEPTDNPPVLHLGGGGPGNALPLGETQINDTWQNHRLMSLEQGLDLVLMDPRGVGLATPRLSCNEWLGTVRDSWSEPLPLSREWEISLAADRRCIERLTRDGVNLAMYNSAAVARDVEALRKAMGVTQWNLYGVSYGSRYALTLARDFPHSVASMVLDGVVFPNLRYEEKGAITSELAIRRAFAWCQANPHCRADYPEIEERFWALAESLNEKPLSLTVTDPETFEQLPVSLTGYRLFSVMFYATYDERYHFEFPAVVRSLEHRNTDLIAPHLRRYLGYLLDPSDSDVALATHYCYEEYPFVDSARTLQAARGYRAVIRDPLIQSAENTRDWCEAWLGGISGPEIEGLAITTDIPTLVLHGELDPVLPVEDIEAQLAGFENVELITYPDIAHDVVSASYCAEMAAGAFYSRGLDFADEQSCSE